MTVPGSINEISNISCGGGRVSGFEFDIVGESVGHNEDHIESFGWDECPHKIEGHLREPILGNGHRMQKSSRCLSRGFVSSARGAGFDIEFDIALYSRPVIIRGD